MTDAISRSEESEVYPIDGEALFNRVQNLKRYDIRRNMFDEIAFMHAFKDQDVLSAILLSKRLDVAPVVRCYECKYRCTQTCPMYHTEICLDDLDGFDSYDTDRTDDNGFCHLGARMDGEENG